MTAASGLIIVDKPSGWTSHDVVARIRVLAGTRRVGHGGTLDPMATGVLLVGVGKATRLLGYLAHCDKDYLATIRLGQSTHTGDAEGAVVAAAPAAGVSLADARAAAAALTGVIQQVPPAVSAIKVDGRRAYRLVREGKAPVLEPRSVTVSRFDLTEARPEGDLLDVDAAVRCSSGTYVRALARDLGEALGVGGHLTMLRRTRVGPYTLAQAHPLEGLSGTLPLMSLGETAARAFPVRALTEEEAHSLSRGVALPATGAPPGPVAALSPGGDLIALVEDRDGRARPVAVFVP